MKKLLKILLNEREHMDAITFYGIEFLCECEKWGIASSQRRYSDANRHITNAMKTALKDCALSTLYVAMGRRRQLREKVFDKWAQLGRV